MGFGMEILFILMLGLLLLGPKKLHTLLEHVAQAKAQFADVRRGFTSQLKGEFDDRHPGGKAEGLDEL